MHNTPPTRDSPIILIGPPAPSPDTCKDCGLHIRHVNCICADLLLAEMLQAEDDGLIRWNHPEREWQIV